MIYVGIDPGNITGITVYDRAIHEYETYELPQELIVVYDYLTGVNRWRGKVGRVLIERFDYRRGRPNVDLFAVEVIGVVQLWCQQNDIPLHRQPQLKGKSGLWSNATLKKLDLYHAPQGRQHMMDSLRQVLYYIQNNEDDNYWVEKLRG